MTSISEDGRDWTTWKAEGYRQRSIDALELWFEFSIARGHKRLIQMVNRRPSDLEVPDERIRPESFYGGGRSTGSITASGVESAPPGESSPPHGWRPQIQVVDTEEAEAVRREIAARQDVLKVMVPTMQRLGLVNESCMLTLEMRSAGWSWQAIAHSFEVSRHAVSTWWESGLSCIGFSLIVRPPFGAPMPPPRVVPRARWTDLCVRPRHASGISDYPAREMRWSDLSAKSKRRG